MPRRTASAVALATPAASTPLRDLSALPTSDDPFHAEVALLRRQWKWAAFSQFFYTFAPLLAMPDVTLTDIEDDLTRSTSIVLPRIMHRLLYTLSPDRRLTLDNWQTSLRKQYAKRDPQANPIGPEPIVSLPTPSPEPEEQEREQEQEPKEEPEQSAKPEPEASAEPSREQTSIEDASMNIDSHIKESTLEPSMSRAETELRSLKAETRATSSVAVDVPKGENEPVEESKDWLQLPMLEKLNSMWLLTEWQFHKPARLRQLMKDDDETAQWIKIPARSARKGVAAVAAEETPSGRGSRAAKTQANLKLDLQAKELAELKRQAAMEGRKGRRGSAAAAVDGDADGEFSGSAAPTRSSPRKTRGPPLATPGTRASARLRSSGRRDEDEEWQEIPDEWLMEGVEDGKTEGRKGKGKVVDTVVVPKTGLESDDESVSELTELSEDRSPDEPEEEEEEKPAVAKSKQAANGKGGRKSARTKRAAAVKDGAPEPEPEPETIEDTEPVEEPEPEWRPPDDFVEWETLCVTLSEWEHIADRFEKATHYTEKALYKVLSQHIVPSIVEELREIERQKRLEEAVSHRKRSSRLAMKETEKEEQKLAIQRQAEEEEKMGRARRAEARARKEEEEREKRESAREKRRHDREEREERIRQREMAKVEGGASAVSTPIDVEADESPAPAPRARKAARPSRPSPSKAVAPPTASGSRTPSSTEDWELDCEICYRHGINKVYSSYSGWLSLANQVFLWIRTTAYLCSAAVAGRKKRNWDVEEFICKRCRSSAYATMQHNGSARGYPSGYAQPSGSGQIPYGSYGQGQANSYPRGDAYNQPFPASASTPSRTHPSHTAITFTHYQPQQQGFSRTPVAQAQPFTPAQGYPSSGYGVDPSAASRSVTDYHNNMNSQGGECNTPQPVASFAHGPYVPNGSSWPSSTDGPSHQPNHQLPHQPVQQPVYQPAGAAAAWNAPPLNGYGHYNSSAERSSAGPGPSYDRTSLPPPSHAPGQAPSPSQQWQQSFPAARQTQPQTGPTQAMNTNAYPSSAQEQYHYSAGSVLPQAQHRGP
ncbi:hypothetical protein EWM64_g983 [Hericium alpestre]|uniref:DDT domain-containing protein n=1 Tax=Hericium alpestre TaxID=135208 RepID=A0A4Z0A9L0_9AGAM|nr:hypothetical protein EWM64_g983 [Hericium alpestre]